MYSVSKQYILSCYSPDSNTTAPTSVTVLHAIHGYVDSFFTCEHCRSHFLAMSERMELLAITDDKAANLAMWQAHNQVNARLSTEVYDLHFPKVQFPPLDECGTCANAQQFDTDKVFGYLMKHYRRVLTPFGKMRLVRSVDGNVPPAFNTEQLLQEKTREIIEADLNFYLFVYLCFSISLAIFFIFLCKRKLRFFGNSIRALFRV